MLCAQGAVEVWDYSKVHLKNFEPIFEGMDAKFRHVPFSWFPLVCAFLKWTLRVQLSDLPALPCRWMSLTNENNKHKP